MVRGHRPARETKVPTPGSTTPTMELAAGLLEKFDSTTPTPSRTHLTRLQSGSSVTGPQRTHLLAASLIWPRVPRVDPLSVRCRSRGGSPVRRPIQDRRKSRNAIATHGVDLRLGEEQAHHLSGHRRRDVGVGSRLDRRQSGPCLSPRATSARSAWLALSSSRPTSARCPEASRASRSGAGESTRPATSCSHSKTPVRSRRRGVRSRCRTRWSVKRCGCVSMAGASRSR